MSQPVITYCGNVHPVVECADLEAYLEASTPKVQEAFGKKFPLGLWLPKTALGEAKSELGLSRLRQKLDRLEVGVATFNAFPMEVFHGKRVKEKVYQPDWAEASRLQYTQQVAELGLALGVKDFSISTLSGGFRPLDSDAKKDRFIEHWIQWVRWASDFEEKRGSRVCLALEPEPFNTMEDESDAISLWQVLLERAKEAGLGEELCQRYLGLCFDTCHFSVRYISLIEAYRRLQKAGLPVHKIQVSVAPRWSEAMGEAARTAFFNWNEPVYLHQSYAKVGEQRLDFLDLDQAETYSGKVEEWRTHFHVPIHYGEREDSTGADLIEFLDFLKTDGSPCPLLEVETYSFASMKGQWGEGNSLEKSIAKELTWLKGRMQ